MEFWHYCLLRSVASVFAFGCVLCSTLVWSFWYFLFSFFQMDILSSVCVKTFEEKVVKSCIILFYTVPAVGVLSTSNRHPWVGMLWHKYARK